MLLFKKKFFDAIRSGEKTQTIRLWKRAQVRVGQLCFVPGLGRVLITAVDAVELKALTEADAQRDGFPSVAALRKEIRTLYADRLNAGYATYRVQFEVAELLTAGKSKQSTFLV